LRRIHEEGKCGKRARQEEKAKAEEGSRGEQTEEMQGTAGSREGMGKQKRQEDDGELYCISL
jgi:hypothetical protein